jgi:hypothetical protein
MEHYGFLRTFANFAEGPLNPYIFTRNLEPKILSCFTGVNIGINET